MAHPFQGTARVQRSSSSVLAAALAVAMAMASLGVGSWVFAMPASSKMRAPRPTAVRRHEQPMPRANLPRHPLEIALEVEEPEAEAPLAMPPHRIPYTMHVVTQMPHHEHLKEESRTRKALEQKITHALVHFEDFIRHVEVRFTMQEHFHRDKAGAHKKVVRAKAPRGLEMENDDVFEDLTGGVPGPRMPAPFQLKVVVSMKNHKQVVYSNPEKHAQETLQECMDLAVDGLTHLLREEKARIIAKNRKSKAEEALKLDMDLMSEEALDREEADIQEQAAQQMLAMQDAEMEKLYAAVEAASEKE